MAISYNDFHIRVGFGNAIRTLVDSRPATLAHASKREEKAPELEAQVGATGSVATRDITALASRCPFCLPKLLTYGNIGLRLTLQGAPLSDQTGLLGGKT